MKAVYRFENNLKSVPDQKGMPAQLFHLLFSQNFSYSLLEKVLHFRGINNDSPTSA
ncbi:hypothetical protein C0J52_02800 [Blattella germanica]|nr:hypothetical protein C0J52_02800 [Blattella germanica]